MAELKTQRTNVPVEQFLDSVEDPKRREEGKVLHVLFQESTNEEPAMWGSSIVGYGSYHYKSTRSKQEGDWPLTGFSPRKQNLSLYIMPGFDRYTDLLSKLGKHKTSVGCLYIKKLVDIDTEVLKELIRRSVADMKEMNTN